MLLQYVSLGVYNVVQVILNQVTTVLHVSSERLHPVCVCVCVCVSNLGNVWNERSTL